MSSELTTIRVGGVPEHFNSPWHIAIESGAFAKAGLDVQWTTIDTGTGAMCKALANGEIDIAVALTEGVVADIAKGRPPERHSARILQRVDFHCTSMGSLTASQYCTAVLVGTHPPPPGRAVIDFDLT